MTEGITRGDVTEEYLNNIFTEEGRTTFETYLKAISEFYFKAETFPCVVPMAFGIPNIKAFQTMTSKEDMQMKISVLALLLNVKSINIKTDTHTHTIDLGAGQGRFG